MTTDNLETVFLRNRRPLVRLLTRLTGNGATAEDLAHEVYLRVLIASRERRIVNPRAVLYQSARNLARDHLRRLDRRKAVMTDRIGAEALDRVAAECPSPETEVYGRQLMAQLRATLAGLTWRQRQILLSARLHGYSYGTIARRLDVSTSTVQKELKAATAACSRTFARVGR